jgi:hypothetical protein
MLIAVLLCAKIPGLPVKALIMTNNLPKPKLVEPNDGETEVDLQEGLTVSGYLEDPDGKRSREKLTVEIWASVSRSAESIGNRVESKLSDPNGEWNLGLGAPALAQLFVNKRETHLTIYARCTRGGLREDSPKRTICFTKSSIQSALKELAHSSEQPTGGKSEIDLENSKTQGKNLRLETGIKWLTIIAAILGLYTWYRGHSLPKQPSPQTPSSTTPRKNYFGGDVNRKKDYVLIYDFYQKYQVCINNPGRRNSELMNYEGIFNWIKVENATMFFECNSKDGNYDAFGKFRDEKNNCVNNSVKYVRYPDEYIVWDYSPCKGFGRDIPFEKKS